MACFIFCVNLGELGLRLKNYGRNLDYDNESELKAPEGTFFNFILCLQP